jgi:hypothetical protein
VTLFRLAGAGPPTPGGGTPAVHRAGAPHGAPATPRLAIESPPPISPTSEMVWCGARKGRLVTSAVRAPVRPATRSSCTPLVETKAPYCVLVDSTRVANAASWVRSTIYASWFLSKSIPWRLLPRSTNFPRLHGERTYSVSMAGEIAALRKARSNPGAPKLTKSQDVMARFGT